MWMIKQTWKFAKKFPFTCYGFFCFVLNLLLYQLHVTYESSFAFVVMLLTAPFNFLGVMIEKRVTIILGLEYKPLEIGGAFLVSSILVIFIFFLLDVFRTFAKIYFRNLTLFIKKE